nr:hypothetical protein SHINE37_70107 [Rhizobiaceae bacterium]
MASRRPQRSRPLARPVRSAPPASCEERSSSCRLRRPVRRPGPMRKITPDPKTSIRIGTRHIGPAARLSPVPARAIERRALAMTSAPRSAIEEWSSGKGGEGNGRQTDRQRCIHEPPQALAQRLQAGTPGHASPPVPPGPFPLMPTL